MVGLNENGKLFDRNSKVSLEIIKKLTCYHTGCVGNDFLGLSNVRIIGHPYLHS